MHPNPIFRQATEKDNLDFARERGFGTLAVNGSEGPLFAHVPFWISPDGTYAEFHLVRSNPVIRGAAPQQNAVLSAHGPDAYISPDWYDLEHQVPTWNYVAVHLRGVIETLPATEMCAHLDRLSAFNEERLLPKEPWLTEKVPEDVLDKLMRAIVPCRMSIDKIDGTWKIGQDKPADARVSAAKYVKTYDHGQETTLLAALMASYSETK